MNTPTCQPETTSVDLFDEATWNGLYLLLMSLVKRWVYQANVPSWRGQEVEVAQDMVQAALRKTFEYALNARSHGIGITSLERLCVVIARNQLRDQRRKDGRLLHIELIAESPEAENAIFSEEDPAEGVLERHFQEWLFSEIAKEVVQFPEKTRLAVLVYLAERLEAQGELYGEPTPLRRAFLKEGVHLEQFIHLLPADPVARARHSSLASLGFKRIADRVKRRLEPIYADALQKEQKGGMLT